MLLRKDVGGGKKRAGFRGLRPSPRMRDVYRSSRIGGKAGNQQTRMGYLRTKSSKAEVSGCPTPRDEYKEKKDLDLRQGIKKPPRRNRPGWFFFKKRPALEIREPGREKTPAPPIDFPYKGGTRKGENGTADVREPKEGPGTIRALRITLAKTGGREKGQKRGGGKGLK